MAKHSVRTATPADLIYIRDNLREADRLELEATGDVTLQLVDGFARSDWVEVACLDDVPYCVYGVAPSPEHVSIGVPWMVGTPAIVKTAKRFLRDCPDTIDRLQFNYPVLVNWIDERNKLAQRWLKWLGFTLGKPTPYGLNGEPFIPFIRRHPACVVPQPAQR